MRNARQKMQVIEAATEAGRVRARAVGGRQDGEAPPRAGGGYLATCTDTSADIAPAELFAAAKLGPVWLGLAEQLGVPEFLRVWEALDALANPPDAIMAQRVRVPRYALWARRVARNADIERLSAEGQSVQAIRRYIARQYGAISYSSVEKLARPARIRKR